MEAETTNQAEAEPAPAIEKATATETSPSLGKAAPPAETEEPAPAKEAEPPADTPYEWKFAEGHQPDPGTLGAFEKVVKENGIKQEVAQKVWDTMSQKMREVQSAVIEKWQKAVVADKEFGGDKLQATLQKAGRVIDKFGTPELRAWFNESGAGSHPELFRVFARISDAMSEDAIAVGKPAPAERPSLGKLFFPEMVRK